MLCLLQGEYMEDIMNWATDCFPSLCRIPSIPQILASCLWRHKCNNWARRSDMNDAEDPVSNSAWALTIPCGELTMTWHVVNRMLDWTETCRVGEVTVISAELSAGGSCLRSASLSLLSEWRKVWCSRWQHLQWLNDFVRIRPTTPNLLTTDYWTPPHTLVARASEYSCC